MIVIELDNGHDDWPWWKPGWHDAPFAGGRFKRLWWWFIAISWVRMNLRDYNDYVRSGLSEWRHPQNADNPVDQFYGEGDIA